MRLQAGWIAMYEQVFGLCGMQPGDAFKRHLQDPVRLRIGRDHGVAVAGDSVDAAMMRGDFEAWAGPAAQAVSHVGRGPNRRARWDALTFCDKADLNGTGLRACAGGFLDPTGANAVAVRHTEGHVDLPPRGCTVALDGVAVVDAGRLP
ncbi:MAG: hypothetical protein KGK09_16455 [Burkholderiales bacterium]|nr:hypothetical protein [Burkholderiales bacterium]